LGVDSIAPTAYGYLGWSYYELGRYQDAVYLFERAAAFDSENADTYNGLGWCYEQLERCDEAVPMFDRALDLDPDMQKAREGKDECR